MRNVGRWLAAVAVAVAGLPMLVDAHFVLVQPEPWLVQDVRGDPQKLGPCGGTTANAGTPTNVIGSFHGNDKLHLKIQETIYHPGHYRVSLAVKSRVELPSDPEVITRESERGPWSVSAAIQSAPAAPVLADGLFAHSTKPNPGEFFETDIQLPNITCEKCTLQVVQFMAEHGYNRDGGYFYHHCADLQITADSSKPIDTAWAR